MRDRFKVGLHKGQKKLGMANRNDDPDFEHFLLQWRLQLKRGGTSESVDAVRELKEKQVFKYLETEEKPGDAKRKYTEHAWRSGDICDRAFQEIKAYRTESVARIKKEYFDDVEELLYHELEKIRKMEAKFDETAMPIPELRCTVEKLAKEMRKALERAKRSVAWSRQRMQNWKFGVWQSFWPEQPRKMLVSKKIELDTRLQIELGKIFADHLRYSGITMETIARLICLVYLAGDLAYVKEDEKDKSPRIWLPSSSRELTVRNIRDTLRRAGIHKAKGFETNIPSSKKTKQR